MSFSEYILGFSQTYRNAKYFFFANDGIFVEFTNNKYNTIQINFKIYFVFSFIII